MEVVYQILLHGFALFGMLIVMGITYLLVVEKVTDASDEARQLREATDARERKRMEQWLAYESMGCYSHKVGRGECSEHPGRKIRRWVDGGPFKPFEPVTELDLSPCQSVDKLTRENRFPGFREWADDVNQLVSVGDDLLTQAARTSRMLQTELKRTPPPLVPRFRKKRKEEL